YVCFSLVGFPFDQLEAEINELQGSSNITTAADQYLTSIKSKTDQLIQTANTFDTVRVGAMRDLVAIKSLVDENADYASVVDSNLNTIIMSIRGVKMQSVGKIVSPLDTKIESVVQEKSRLNYLFPALVAIIIMFVGLFLASSLEVRERSDHVAFKNIITPTSRWVFLLANFFTSMFVIMMQLAVLFFAALFFFQEDLLHVLLPLIAVLLLLAGVFVLLGMLIGTIFKSPETSMVGALSVGFILLFLSSTILPLEAMPTFLAQIVPYNPFYAGHLLLSKILLFQAPLTDLVFSLLTLGGWFIGLLGISFFTGSLRHDS
ncbi:MAG: ABC transporter permease, partial [Nanoarchaeota archaeon]